MTADLIATEEVTTLAALFKERVKRTPNNPAYHYFDRTEKVWKQYTWQGIGEQVARWQAALMQSGLQAGDKVAIMVRNSPEWVMCEQAALGLGLVVVPLYVEDRADNVVYILSEAEVKLLVIETLNQWKRLYQMITTLPQLSHVILIYPPETKQFQDNRLISLEKWLSEIQESELQQREVAAQELASIVYTSGTTGRPKGVMLSHDNIFKNAQYASVCAHFSTDDIFLSFLPLSHMFERTAGHYLPMIIGASVAYARSIPQLSNDLMHIRPTVLISVPRIYEQVSAKIRNQIEKSNWLKRNLFSLAMKVGLQHFEYRQKRASWQPSLLLQPLLQKQVGNKVLAKLGGRLRLAICGGAALSSDVAEMFIALGLNLQQGYGLTEASPVITVNLVEDNIPASIGLPLPNIEVKLGEQDELLTRSDCVMLGYWKNPQATADLIDADGWLHTGDKARVDNRGHWYITGRIKDIIVLGNGEKVPPADMEMMITRDPLFEQVMVLGEGKPFLSALVVLNAEAWQTFANQLSVAPEASSLQQKQVHKAVLEKIAAQIKEFPGYAQIRRVILSLEPWTVENGFLTPTLKMKRAKIMEEFNDSISAMYKGF